MTRFFCFLILSVWIALSPATGHARSDKIFQAQQRLEILGISPGPVDGLMGEKTRDAIREFQRRNSLPVTGELDPETEFTLLATSVRSAPSNAAAKSPGAAPVPKVSALPLVSPSSKQVGVSSNTAPPTSGSASRLDQTSKTFAPQQKEIWRPNFWLLGAAGLALYWWLRRRA